MSQQTHQSIIDLIVRQKGQDTVDGLTRSTAELAARIEGVNDSFAKGDISSAEYTKSIRALDSEYAKQIKLLN